MTDLPPPAPASPPAPGLFLEAIARHKCVSAVYNRQTMILAPHILYTRHGEMHVDAVTISRDGAPPREAKLGTFKLAGLRDARLVEQAFRRSTLFDSADPRYDGVTLFAVEPS